MAIDPVVHERISDLIRNNRVLLFMKGTRHFPQCGFSATVTQILDGLISDYETVNVLKDPDVRQAIKDFSNWPTIPQLYVDGKFIGGCDIVREMFLAGELHGVLGVADQQTPPSIHVTQAARAAFEEAAGDELSSGAALRIEINPSFEYALSVDTAQKGDFELDVDGLAVLIDRGSAAKADGLTIDYSAAGQGGFKIENPNEPAKVRQLSVHELAEMRKRGESHELFDVRTDDEIRTASLQGARQFTEEVRASIASLPRETTLVFMCHHGGRSQAAAESALSLGFTRVFSVGGGIDAWSLEIDDSVPRY